MIIPSNVGGRVLKNLALTIYGSLYSTQANNTWGLVVTPDGSTLYTTDNNGSATLNKWPINADGTLGTRSILQGNAYGIGVAANNNYVVRPNYSSQIDIISTQTFSIVAQIPSSSYYSSFYGSPAIAPDSSAIVHGYAPVSNSFGFWSTSGTLLGYSNLGVDYQGAVFSPDSSKVYFHGSDGYIHGFHTSTRSRFSYAGGLYTYQQRNAIAISPTGDRVYCMGANGSTLVTFTTANNLLTASWTATVSGTIYSIAASPDGSRVYCGTSSGYMYAFNSTTGAQIGSTLIGLSGNFFALGLSADGGTAYVGGGGVQLVV